MQRKDHWIGMKHPYSGMSAFVCVCVWAACEFDADHLYYTNGKNRLHFAAVKMICESNSEQVGLCDSSVVVRT